MSTVCTFRMYQSPVFTTVVSNNPELLFGFLRHVPDLRSSLPLCESSLEMNSTPFRCECLKASQLLRRESQIGRIRSRKRFENAMLIFEEKQGSHESGGYSLSGQWMRRLACIVFLKFHFVTMKFILRASYRSRALP